MPEKPEIILTEQEQQAVELFKSFVENTNKFRTKGTAAAAVRARKALSAISKLAPSIRKQIQADKKVKVAEKRAAKAARNQSDVGVTSL